MESERPMKLVECLERAEADSHAHTSTLALHESVCACVRLCKVRGMGARESEKWRREQRGRRGR